MKVPHSTRSALRTAVCACVLICAGCTAPWSLRNTEPLSISHANGEQLPAPEIEAAPSISQAQEVVTFNKAEAERAPLTADEEIALSNFVGEVRNTTVLDAAAEEDLRGQLRQAPQDEWPLVVKQFRAARAYRAELLARESQRANDFNRASHTTRLPSFPPTTENLTSSSGDIQKLQSAVAQAQSVHLAQHIAPVAAYNNATPLPHDEPLPVRGTTVANHSTEVEPTTTPIEQVAHVAPLQQAAPTQSDTDWQTHLSNSIDAMQKEVESHPGSTDELQEHMRLRMLLLMAGRDAEALAPIPGASPTEQDYWSKQLFAISTYFDHERQPETKKRAAGALLHLEQARAKLAELATLQVRNLRFVNKVEGYGLYEARSEMKFKPGDQVTLYAEVDNFRSESTKTGYHTTFATSYEVVDPQGRRVDGAQFPEVEDLCQNQRRDYHITYGVALPERIYPGQYEMRVIITDQLSNKIGQSSIPFEIVD